MANTVCIGVSGLASTVLRAKLSSGWVGAGASGGHDALVGQPHPSVKLQLGEQRPAQRRLQFSVPVGHRAARTVEEQEQFFGDQE